MLSKKLAWSITKVTLAVLSICIVNFWITSFCGLNSTQLEILYPNISTEKHREQQQLQQQKQPNHQEQQGAFDLLINAYHRSGSTYFGTLLGYRTDTFYWYEPFWKPVFQRYYCGNGSLCSIITPSCRNEYGDNILSITSAMEFLTDIFNCSLEQHFNRFGDYFSLKGHAGPYKKCRTNGTSDSKCYPYFVNECKAANHRTTKLIRLDVHHTEALLQRFPRLKVIQLMRDPRAMINSRFNSNWYPIKEGTSYSKEIRNNAVIQCSRMRSDIEGAHRLLNLFPNRVKIIQYEAFVGEKNIKEIIYKWLGMDPLNVDPRMLNLEKSSTDFVRDSYRKTMQNNTLHIIQSQCADVIQQLGLNLFNRYEDMINGNISVIDRVTYPL